MRVWACVFVAVAVTMEMGVVATMSKVELVNNGYEGVVVGVSSRVDASLASEIIAGLKKMLKEGSKAMLKATRNRAYLRDVTILVPLSWTHVEEEDAEGALFLKQEDSDIRVDIPESPYQDQPYTLQTGICGASGLYIHYTPAYITDDELVKWWGARGTSLAYEWAKLRWGVFDEIGYPGDPKYPPHYKSMRHGGSVVPTMCGPTHVEGGWEDEEETECPRKRDGTPEGNCYFTATNCSSVSLMSLYSCRSQPELEFCDEETHNYEAPTKQNRICKLSVWQVMEGHRDFASGANPPLDPAAAQDVPEPRVRVVRERPPGVALVTDVSGSMNEHHRYKRLQRAITRWILRDAPDNTSLAIIRFSDDVQVVQNLTQLDSEATRRALAQSLNCRPAGGTGIGAGLLKAIEVLENEIYKLIFLVTDGEENEKPYIADMKPDLLRSGARVITLGIGKEADSQLRNLSIETSGTSFHFLDENYSFDMESSLDGILDFIPSRTKSTVLYKKTFLKVSPMTLLEDEFFVDCCPDEMGVIIDMESNNPSKPQLKQPNGQAVQGRFEKLLNAWVFDVTKPESGNWLWHVRLKAAAHSVRVSVKVKADESSIISVRTSIHASPTKTNSIVMAEIKKGVCPVQHARISVETKDINSGDETTMVLRDDGEHSDLISGDGIYSGALISEGTFIMAAEIRGTKETVACPASSRRRRRRRQLMRRPPYCCGSAVRPTGDLVPTGTFNRPTSSGSIDITNAPTKGALPPSPVRDLQVTALAPNVFQLSWTATGDDLDDGVVSDYELLMLPNGTGRAKDFEHARPVTLSSVTQRDFKTKVLVEAGSKVVVNVSLELDQENFLTIRAVDAQGHRGEVSNVVTLSFARDITSVALTEVTTETLGLSSTADFVSTSASTSDPRNNLDRTKDKSDSVNGTGASGHSDHSARNIERGTIKVVVIVLFVSMCLVTIAVCCAVHYYRRKGNWIPK